MSENKIALEGFRRAKDDTKIIQDTSFDKNFGIGLNNKYYEHFPMFFTRFGSEIDLIGQYHGASIFFICNGPSVVNSGYDLSLLKKPGIMTYGINNGPRTVRPNLWSCVDDPARFSFSIWNDPCITKIVPFSFAEKNIFDNEKWEMSKKKVQDCPNMIYIRRNEKLVYNRFLKELTYNWGNHKDFGGGRSVMLMSLKIMFLLGFRKVYLLGADFNMSETNTYHFDEQRSKGAVHGNMNTYEKLKNEFFPALKPHFDAEGFHVYNLNPKSALKVFDFVNYNDAIKEASKELGDVDNERTWGMYSIPKEKAKWKNEPSPEQKAHLATIKNRPQTPICFDDDNDNEMDWQDNEREEITAEDPIAKIDMSKLIVKAPSIPLAQPASPRIKIGSIPSIPSIPSIQRQDRKTPNVPSMPVTPEVIRKPQITNQPNTIIRNKPCGAITTGSSSTIKSPNDLNNVTIPDNGR